MIKILTIFVLGLLMFSGIRTEASVEPAQFFFNTLYNTTQMNYKEIGLTNSTDMVLVDAEDFGFLNRFKWRIDDGGYCERAHDHLSIHRLILGKESSVKLLDHKNRIKLDNRKQNLRMATATQNSVNRAPKREGKFKGVTYLPKYIKRKNRKGIEYTSPVKYRYRAILKHGSKNYCLGYFLTPEEAAIAYDKKAFELHGEYAYINLPNKLIK